MSGGVLLRRGLHRLRAPGALGPLARPGRHRPHRRRRRVGGLQPAAGPARRRVPRHAMRSGSALVLAGAVAALARRLAAPAGPAGDRGVRRRGRRHGLRLPPHQRRDAGRVDRATGASTPRRSPSPTRWGRPWRCRCRAWPSLPPSGRAPTRSWRCSASPWRSGWSARSPPAAPASDQVGLGLLADLVLGDARRELDQLEAGRRGAGRGDSPVAGSITSMTPRSVMIRCTTPLAGVGQRALVDDLVASRPWRRAPSAR